MSKDEGWFEWAGETAVTGAEMVVNPLVVPGKIVGGTVGAVIGEGYISKGLEYGIESANPLGFVAGKALQGTAGNAAGWSGAQIDGLLGTTGEDAKSEAYDNPVPTTGGGKQRSAELQV